MISRNRNTNPTLASVRFRRGRYALWCLALGGGLLVGGACAPTKPPAPSAALNVSPTSFDYGEVDTGGGTDPITFTVTNNGPNDSGELAVTIDQPDPPQFQFGKRIPGVDDTCSGAVLAKGETCTVGVEFAPSSDGTHQATLLVSAPSSGTASAALSGTGVSQ